jgi:hypothetical protein
MCSSLSLFPSQMFCFVSQTHYSFPTGDTFKKHVCLQVVATDINECIEALEGNVAVNLPPGSTIVKSGNFGVEARVSNPAPGGRSTPGEALPSSTCPAEHIEDTPGSKPRLVCRNKCV